jgi:hypothetical protein
MHIIKYGYCNYKAEPLVLHFTSLQNRSLYYLQIKNHSYIYPLIFIYGL